MLHSDKIDMYYHLAQREKMLNLISLDKREKLANADIERVRADLQDVGYYLQFPPPVENLLSEYRELND